MPRRPLKITLPKGRSGPINGKLTLMLLAMILGPLTLWGTTHSFNLTMMALSTFALAYVSKGLRRRMATGGQSSRQN
ncbi:hypothetical protein [Synechocystis sp. LKSZ1]|uniref:hypothetical protein n=1 Tax=Synechocystis sp. LKSZ1 TaxID=3144951 RepID=UPI00336BD9D0